MTIHASKGLEAQHVFLLFPDGIRRKFPSEIEDHFIFNMLKTNTDDYPFSEERRLMYVGITRAQQNLYFVSSNAEPNSVFWDELRELHQELSSE
jgi:DNA helicase-4